MEAFIQTVGRFEDAIFQKRARLLAAQKGRRERDKVCSSPSALCTQRCWGDGLVKTVLDSNHIVN